MPTELKLIPGIECFHKPLIDVDFCASSIYACWDMSNREEARRLKRYRIGACRECVRV